MKDYRYRYSGSNADPEQSHFESGEWLSEEECRRVMGRCLRISTILPGSLVIFVQRRVNGRWSKYRFGPVDKIFPEVVRARDREVALNAILSEADIADSLSRIVAESAIRRNVVAEELERARHVVSVLEKIQALDV